MILLLIVYNSESQICLIYPKEGLFKQLISKQKQQVRTTEKEAAGLKPRCPRAILLLQQSSKSSSHEENHEDFKGNKADMKNNISL